MSGDREVAGRPGLMLLTRHQIDTLGMLARRNPSALIRLPRQPSAEELRVRLHYHARKNTRVTIRPDGSYRLGPVYERNRA